MGQLLFPVDVVLNDFGRHAAHQRIRQHVFSHDCTSRNHCTAADAHAFKDGDIEAYPHVVLNDDRRRDIGIVVDRMVVAIADGDTARNDDAVTDGDGREAVDGGIVVDVAAAEREFRTIVYREMAAGHQVKMPLDTELRILGQLEFGRKIPQPRPLATQFECAVASKGRRRCGENAHIWKNFNTVAFFLVSKLRSSITRNKRSLRTYIKEVFQMHSEIIPNARLDDGFDYYLAQRRLLSL